MFAGNSGSRICLARSQSGVTLIELMIVILIAAILLVMVAPSFQESLKRNRRQVALKDTLSILSSARSEAVARAVPVSVCPSSDGASCSGNATWEEGFLLFEDDGAGAGVRLDLTRTGNEEVIRAFGAAGPGVTIRSKGSFSNTQGIAFSSFGAAIETGTLHICDVDGPTGARAVVLNRSGQPRLATDEDASADGIVNDDAGANLGTCP